MNKHIKQLLIDLAWVLVAGAVAVAFILAAANLGGCKSIDFLQPTPEAGQQANPTPGSGLGIYPLLGACAMLAGAGMIAAKFWMPVIPVGGSVGLLAIGIFMAFVPTLVAKFWLPFGIMLMIVAGIVAVSFVANWLGLRKSGLPAFKRQKPTKHELTCSDTSNPSGTQSESDELSPHFLKG